MSGTPGMQSQGNALTNNLTGTGTATVTKLTGAPNGSTAGSADHNTIAIRGDKIDGEPGETMLILHHEQRHVEMGGVIGPCAHAALYQETIDLAWGLINEGVFVSWAFIEDMMKEQAKYQKQCDSL